MYKWYVCNYINWWTNEGEDFPEKHIENFKNIEWSEISNPAIKFEFPIETAILTTTLENNPRYIKAVDSKGQSFYFYYTTVSEVKTSDIEGVFYYECVYTLDTYMSYIQLNLELLRQEKPAVKFVRKFYDRLVYSVNPQGILSYTLDYVNQKWLGNIDEDKNYQLVRSYVGGTNPTKLWTNNNTASPLVNYSFKSFRNFGTTLNVPYTKLSTPDSKNRFSYIIAKSSALLDSTNKSTYVDGTYIVIPLFEVDKNNILSALQNINITTADVQINALSSGNFIARKSIDLPFSAFLNKTDVSLEYAINKLPNSTNNQNIFYFRVPYGFLNELKIFDYSQYENGFEGKIRYFINNLNYWDEKTEPKLLNPIYYQEKMVIDNDKFISTDISLIKYKTDDARFPSRLSLYMNFAFESDFVAFYDFKEFNNESNVNWNNNYSNLRSILAYDEGLVGSSTGDYYDTNKATLSTASQNLKEQQGADWVNYGFDRVQDVIGVAKSSFSIENVFTGGAKTYTAAASAAVNAAQGAFNNVIKHKIENRNLAKDIQNIISTPNRLISNAYASSFISNKNINGDMLFQLYKYELHPMDAKREFGEIASKGYAYVSIDTFNTYDNRQFMNILHIDVEYNKVVLINLLKSLTGYNIFNSSKYIYDTLSFMSTMKRLYKNEEILNVINPGEVDYVPNIENILPQIPTNALPINTLFSVTNFPNDYFFTTDSIIDKLKNSNPDFKTQLDNGLKVEYSFQNNFVIITVLPDQNYYGYVEVIYYAYVQPNHYAIDGNVKPITLNTTNIEFDRLNIVGNSNEALNEVYDKLLINIRSTRPNTPVRLFISYFIGNDLVVNSDFDLQSDSIKNGFQISLISTLFVNNTLPNYINQFSSDFLIQTKRHVLFNEKNINYNSEWISRFIFGNDFIDNNFSQITNIRVAFPITKFIDAKGILPINQFNFSFSGFFRSLAYSINFPLVTQIGSNIISSLYYRINNLNRSSGTNISLNFPNVKFSYVDINYTSGFLTYDSAFILNCATNSIQSNFVKTGNSSNRLTYIFNL